MESALLANRAGVPGFCRRALGRGVLVPWPALGLSAVLSSSAQIILKDACRSPSTSSMAQGKAHGPRLRSWRVRTPSAVTRCEVSTLGPNRGPARIGPVIGQPRLGTVQAPERLVHGQDWGHRQGEGRGRWWGGGFVEHAITLGDPVYRQTTCRKAGNGGVHSGEQSMVERSRYFPGHLVPIPSLAPSLESLARERASRARRGRRER